MCLACFGHLGGGVRFRYSSDTYEELFRKGVDSYTREKWHDCISSMLNAMDERKEHNKILVQCRSKCRDDDEGATTMEEEKEEDGGDNELEFFGKTLSNTLCLLKCKKQRLPEKLHSSALVPRYIEDAFDSRLPYDYLQLCYYKIGNVVQAASCAYTFLTMNPEHEVMRSNLQFYASVPGLDLDKVKNLEKETFQELYLMGNEAYNKKNYHEVVHYFEAALEEYYEAEEHCRLLCEGPFDQNGFPDFIMSIANHFAYVLKCKQRCADKLSFMYGETYTNYVSSHYHYLQFAYFQVGDVRKACQAVGTYFLFHANDTTMNYNKKFYSTSEGISEDDFTPPKDVVNYLQRDKREKKLLKYIEDKYKFDDLKNDVDELGSVSDDSAEAEADKKFPQLGETGIEQKQRMKKRKIVDFAQWSKENGIEVTMDEKQLNGTLRFVADGFATSEQCDQLMDLAVKAAVFGDGYNGKQSPHTEFELFEGLTVGRAAMLVKLGMIDVESVQAFVNLSERGRDYVEKYFNLNQPLYFSYTHLVCRTSISDSDERSDLSHPIHADNCILQNDGECIKKRPGYVWRDYSSIIYLNDDFDGGEFIFAENKTAVQAHVKPKCGRLVGFSSGKENLHGVKAVNHGRRCAVAMWYTLDTNHRERERELAQQVLDDISKDGNFPKPPLKSIPVKIKAGMPMEFDSTCSECSDRHEDLPKISKSTPQSVAEVESKIKGSNHIHSNKNLLDVEDSDVVDKFSLENYDGYNTHPHGDL